MKNVLLIGLGLFGSNIAKKLNELKHDVLAIDIDENRVNDILPYVTEAQIGDCTDEEYMKSIGVNNFDVCIVAIGDNFQSSLEVTSLLKELGAPLVVSRASSDVHKKFLEKNGADEIIYPEMQLASWVAIRYTADHILDYIKLDDNYGIYEVLVPKEWENKTVGELNIRQKYHVNILGVKKQGDINLTVKSETLLSNDSTILVLGEGRNIKKCFRI